MQNYYVKVFYLTTMFLPGWQERARYDETQQYSVECPVIGKSHVGKGFVGLAHIIISISHLPSSP